VLQIKGANNFSANDNCFLDFSFKEISPNTSKTAVVLINVQPVSFFLQMCQEKGQVHPSAPNLEVFLLLWTK